MMIMTNLCKFGGYVSDITDNGTKSMTTLNCWKAVLTMRLIDADALGRFSFHIECEEDGKTFERCVVDWDDIEDAPTVDAVILPCNIGDTVFVLWMLADPDLCSRCPDFCWGGMGDSHECGKTDDGFRSAECIEIQEWTADLNLILGWIRYNEFNRTVFRTREEAEAALAKMNK